MIVSKIKSRRNNKVGPIVQGVLLNEYIEQIKWKDEGLILKTTTIRKEYLEMKKRIKGIK
jgi:hypothetical protein